jgi:hypothetical protein
MITESYCLSGKTTEEILEDIYVAGGISVETLRTILIRDNLPDDIDQEVYEDLTDLLYHADIRGISTIRLKQR